MNFSDAERLARLRRKHGYSQGELARKLGLSRQAVSKWERAEAAPDTENLIALARLYQVTLDELVGLSTPSGPMPERPAASERDDPIDGEVAVTKCDEPINDFPDSETVVPELEDYVDDELVASGADDSFDGEAVVSGPDRPEDALDALSAPDASASVSRASPRVCRVAVILLLAAVLTLAAGSWYALTAPHPRVTDALGITSTYVDDVNFAGIERVVVNWPAGEVTIKSTSSTYPFRIEEHGRERVKQGCFQKKGSTLEVWSGDARAWNDPFALAHDLTISVPKAEGVSTADEARSTSNVVELVVNTASGSFVVKDITASVLEATMREGSLTLTRCSLDEYRLS